MKAGRLLKLLSTSGCFLAHHGSCPLQLGSIACVSKLRIYTLLLPLSQLLFNSSIGFVALLLARASLSIADARHTLAYSLLFAAVIRGTERLFVEAMFKQKKEAEAPKAVKATHIWSAVTRFLRWQEVDEPEPSVVSNINFNEEYEKACRTESYLEFTKRAQVLAQAQLGNKGNGASPKLRSFELLAATLLEPDEDKVLAILVANKDIRKKPELFQLVSDYFDQSMKASSVCTLLLKSIEKTRTRCECIKEVLSSILSTGDLGDGGLEELCSFIKEENPFNGAVLQQFQPVHDQYSDMQKKLEKFRKNTGKKLKFARRCLKACTVVITIGCVVFLVITLAALFLAVAALRVGCKVFTFPINYVVRRLNKRKRQQKESLKKQWKQLEAVAQGTFVVVQDLDTMKRLVMRLGSEVEFTDRTIAFCLRHEEDGLVVREALEQLKKNQRVLDQLLDDLEENIYLCFMSINKARGLVVRELCLQPVS